jgi:hypothetical protein
MVSVKITLIWYLTPCSLVGGYQRETNLLPPGHALMTKADFSDTLVPIYKTTQRYIPNDSSLQFI